MKTYRIILMMTFAMLFAGKAVAQKNFVTVMGEVGQPGTYAIPEGQTFNVVEALAAAGDMTIFGMRNKVRVIRPDGNGKFKTVTLNLDNRNVADSPYYQLQPNDRIYVTPNKAKTKSASFGTKSTIWVSMVSTSVSIITMILTKLKP